MQTSKPRIVIVATGGTIAGSAESTTAAGYQSGGVAVDVLIDAVPQMKKFADVRGVQVSSLGSQDMNDELWVMLATEVNRLLAAAGRVYCGNRELSSQLGSARPDIVELF